MATFRKGNMLSHLDECDFALITTNSMVKKSGQLVMGRGIAQQIRDSFRGIDAEFGQQLLERGLHLKKYCIMSNDLYPKIYAFQVKYHWADNADVDLIKDSLRELSSWAKRASESTFFLNFPGIGNGKLGRDVVLSLLDVLPDNVTVWEFG